MREKKIPDINGEMQTVVYDDSPVNYNVLAHEEWAQALTKKHKSGQAELHRKVADALRRHENSPLTIQKILQPIQDGYKAARAASNSMTINGVHRFNLVSRIFCEKKIVTNLFMWFKANDSESVDLLFILGDNPPDSVFIPDRLEAALASVNGRRGMEYEQFRFFPDRWEIGSSWLGLEVLAIWDTIYGNPICLPLSSYLFLRSRYPGASWCLPIDNTRLTPVVLVDGRLPVAGIMPRDLRSPALDESKKSR